MKTIEEMDNSMMEDYRRCPKYFQYRHVDYLSYIDMSSTCKPEFGSALHDGLESWYTHHDPALMDKAFVDRYAEYEGADLSGIRSLGKGLIIMAKYREWFPDEPFDVLELEIGGSVDMGKFLFIFRCDGLIQNKQTGALNIFEHKTSAHKGFLITKPNHQLCGYTFGVRELMGAEVTGALFNIIYFRKGRKNEDQRDTITFNREETLRSKEELQLWRKEVSWVAHQIQASCKYDFFPRNTKGCTTMGGCQYLELCRLPEGPMRDSVKNTLFEVQPWEPFTGARDLDQEKIDNAS